MKRDGKGNTIAKARPNAALAVRPSALSLYWLFGCGVANETIGRCSVVTIDGPLEQKAAWWDGYDAIMARFGEALKDDATGTVILRINSPGGDAAGCFEACRMMRAAAARSGKRVVTYVDEAAYSAAYALACVAGEIYAPPSGGVGSVGVIATCVSVAAMNERIGVDVAVITVGARKADGHPDLPIDPDAVASVQHDVDQLAALFFETVASARGISVGAVQALEAACFMGDEAMSAGLCDGLMGFDELLAMIAADEQTNGATAPTRER